MKGRQVIGFFQTQDKAALEKQALKAVSAYPLGHAPLRHLLHESAEMAERVAAVVAGEADENYLKHAIDKPFREMEVYISGAYAATYGSSDSGKALDIAIGFLALAYLKDEDEIKAQIGKLDTETLFSRDRYPDEVAKDFVENWREESEK